MPRMRKPKNKLLLFYGTKFKVLCYGVADSRSDARTTSTAHPAVSPEPCRGYDRCLMNAEGLKEAPDLPNSNQRLLFHDTCRFPPQTQGVW